MEAAGYVSWIYVVAVLVLGSVGGTLTLAVAGCLLRHSPSKKASDLLLALLAASDIFCVLLVFGPTLVALSVRSLSPILCQLQAYSTTFYLCFQLLLQVLISVERYLALVMPFFYHGLDSTRCVAVAAVVLIVLCATYSGLSSWLIPAAQTSDRLPLCTPRWTASLSCWPLIGPLAAILTLALVVFIFTNARLVVVLWRYNQYARERQLPKGLQRPPLGEHQQSHRHERRKLHKRRPLKIKNQTDLYSFNPRGSNNGNASIDNVQAKVLALAHTNGNSSPTVERIVSNGASVRLSIGNKESPNIFFFKPQEKLNDKLTKNQIHQGRKESILPELPNIVDREQKLQEKRRNFKKAYSADQMRSPPRCITVSERTNISLERQPTLQHMHFYLERILKRLQRRRRRSRNELLLAKVVILASGLFLLLWIPYCVVKIAEIAGSQINQVVFQVTIFAVFLTVLLNPIIHGLCRSNYRSGFIYLLRLAAHKISGGQIHKPKDARIFSESRIQRQKRQRVEVRAANERRPSAYRVFQKSSSEQFQPSARLEALYQRYTDEDSSTSDATFDYDLLNFEEDDRMMDNLHLLWRQISAAESPAELQLDVDYDALIEDTHFKRQNSV